MGQNFVWVGQARVWVGHGLPGLIARTASATEQTFGVQMKRSITEWAKLNDASFHFCL